MKRFFTFFLVASLAISALATSFRTASSWQVVAQGEQSTAFAKKYKQSAAALAENGTKVSRAISLALVEPEQLSKAPQTGGEIYEFEPGDFQYGVVEDEKTGEEYWSVAVTDADWYYTFKFVFPYNNDKLEGTFTEKEIHPTYSHIQGIDEITFEYYYMFFEEVDLVITNTEEEGIDLRAEMLADDGNTYIITAHEDPLPDPIKTVELNYTKPAKLFQGATEFSFEATDMFPDVYDKDSIYTSIYIANSNIIGEYAKWDCNGFGTTIIYNNTENKDDAKYINFLDIKVNITIEDDNYVCRADFLGDDAILYKITMTTPVPTVTETVEIDAINLKVDDEQTEVMKVTYAYASNDAYQVELAYYSETVVGNFVDAQLMGSKVIRTADNMAFDIIKGNITVEEDGMKYKINGELIGANYVRYKIDLSFVLPEVTETVRIDFEKIGESVTIEAEGDLYMLNMNDDYVMALDFVSDLEHPEGEYTEDDFFERYSFLAAIEGTDTTYLDIMDCDAKFTLKDETTSYVEATLICDNAIKYIITSSFTYEYIAKPGLEYDENIQEANVTYTTAPKLSTQEIDGLKGVYCDFQQGLDVSGLLFFVEDYDPIHVIPAGTYTINAEMIPNTALQSHGLTNDGAITYSFHGKLDDSGKGLMQCWFISSGTIIVAHDGDQSTITVDALNSCEIPVRITYKGLLTSIEETAVDETTTKYIGTDGQLYIRRGNHTYTATGICVE